VRERGGVGDGFGGALGRAHIAPGASVITARSLRRSTDRHAAPATIRSTSARHSAGNERNPYPRPSKTAGPVNADVYEARCRSTLHSTGLVRTVLAVAKGQPSRDHVCRGARPLGRYKTGADRSSTMRAAMRAADALAVSMPARAFDASCARPRGVGLPLRRLTRGGGAPPRGASRWRAAIAVSPFTPDDEGVVCSHARGVGRLHHVRPVLARMRSR
jgi:hypothetical protein